MDYTVMIFVAVFVLAFVIFPYLLVAYPLARVRGLLDDRRGTLRGFSGTLEGTYQNHQVKFMTIMGSSRGQGNPALFSIHMVFRGADEGQPEMARASVNCFHRDCIRKKEAGKDTGPIYAVIDSVEGTGWDKQPEVRKVLDEIFTRRRGYKLSIEYALCEVSCRGLYSHSAEDLKSILDGMLVLERTLSETLRAAKPKS